LAAFVRRKLARAFHSRLLELLLENKTQREIAEQLGVDERTIRRRIKSMQDIVNGQKASVDERNGPTLTADSRF
jgi:DNA-binding Lrp family transcriptional regulator